MINVECFESTSYKRILHFGLNYCFLASVSHTSLTKMYPPKSGSCLYTKYAFFFNKTRSLEQSCYPAQTTEPVTLILYAVKPQAENYNVRAYCRQSYGQISQWHEVLRKALLSVESDQFCFPTTKIFPRTHIYQQRSVVKTVIFQATAYARSHKGITGRSTYFHYLSSRHEAIPRTWKTAASLTIYRTCC
jgi:hypothetical protein